LEVTNFEQCAKAGYPILKSYPRQCKTPDGKIFVEEIIKLEFNQGKADCGISEEPEIKVENQEILFSGKLGTPDPCYLLSAELRKEENKLKITISSTKKEDFCIQCPG
jgi:hypothetical protein